MVYHCYKTSDLNEEANCTEPSPSVSIPFHHLPVLLIVYLICIYQIAPVLLIVNRIHPLPRACLTSYLNETCMTYPIHYISWQNGSAYVLFRGLIFNLACLFLKCICCFVKPSNLMQNWTHLKADLHYGNYRSKLVPFEARKNIFYT